MHTGRRQLDIGGYQCHVTRARDTHVTILHIKSHVTRACDYAGPQKYDVNCVLSQGRSQDVSLRGVSVRAKLASYSGVFFRRAKRVRYACRRRFFLGLTARKTSRCNLAIEISFVPSSQSTFNFSVDCLVFNLL